MGTGIALANLRQGIHVRLFDPSADALRRAEAATAQLAVTNAPDTGRLEICHSISQLAGCPLVLESVAENRELKRHVFEQLAQFLTPDAILATNTSTIPLAELASAAPSPQRFCGLHFCNPVEDRPLVEIVRSGESSDTTLAVAVAYVQSLARLPVVVRDSPGFLVNRLLVAYLNEALVMVCQGVDVRALDVAGRELGMALGPLEMLDMMGVDTSMRAGRRLWEAYPDRIALTPILPRLVKLGRLGCKSGAGFYSYSSPAALAADDPRLASILAPYVRRERELSGDEIRLRLVLPMLVEATRVLEESVVADAADVDLALLFGLAMARETGGLLFRADRLGADTVCRQLTVLADLGLRVHPTAWLTKLAQRGGRFYDG
jgi:3-hydroxyacyl-CoA dehydrogenase/enoyl-CoA hydratase/3-hydroxybutyryl-CoA epimerase/3-hydroxyacyl-CoA dehydrogenase/enoyl-CoA hydratase/3-hydroxybutyryl-CoA epimerase/enoyl-CoA isomerase